MKNSNFIVSGLAGMVLLTGSAIVASAQDRRHDHQSQQGQTRQAQDQPVQRQSQPRPETQARPERRGAAQDQQRAESQNRWRNQSDQRNGVNSGQQQQQQQQQQLRNVGGERYNRERSGAGQDQQRAESQNRWRNQQDQRNGVNSGQQQQQQLRNVERDRYNLERQQQVQRQQEQQRATAQRDRRNYDDRSFRNDRGRDQQIAIERQREQQRVERQRRENLNDRYYRNNRSIYSNNGYQHYRVYRNGGYFQTDYNGIGMLQQAINVGYEQGMQAGRADREDSRGYDFENADDFRSGIYGYSGSYVDSSEYSYYFREGFRRGYEDGYYSRFAYGSYSDGRYSILDSILRSVLNAQGY
jgi:hypothetical protein